MSYKMSDIVLIQELKTVIEKSIYQRIFLPI